jgi:hypothetical protein
MKLIHCFNLIQGFQTEQSSLVRGQVCNCQQKQLVRRQFSSASRFSALARFALDFYVAAWLAASMQQA